MAEYGAIGVEILMALRMEALSGAAGRLFETLCGAPIWDDFYLAGGTGLALQIGHRLSADFDLFSSINFLDAPRRDALRRLLSQFGHMEVDADEEGTLRVTLDDVPLSFFRYDYPPVEPLVEHGRVKLASLLDIGLMKVAAVVGRGTKKDFLDLFFLTRESLRLEAILEAGPRKFLEARDFVVQALRALVYFEDAEEEEMPLLLKTAEWVDVKRFFVEEVSLISRNWFGM